MEFYTLASGSSGNASLVKHENTAVLIDAGISARRITQSLARLGLSPAALSAILITHEHDDHIKGMRTLCRQCAAPVYASLGTAQSLAYAGEALRPFRAGDGFTVGALHIQSFPTSHDAADSVGYRIDSAGGSVGILTDTGFVTEAAAQVLRGVELLLLEANYDIEALRSGPYPYFLKERILGARGHLSNDDAAEFALQSVRSGTRDILLSHLSRENNTPVMAEYAVARRLQSLGMTVRLGVAPRDELSEEHRCTLAAAQEEACKR
ncbi:MAG: MBL fold metallo-hydrolase [Oscillospiraceae bacterium]|nr:MBL fold metallo-hydrolase [Oscillospiraceae bacterium]